MELLGVNINVVFWFFVVLSVVTNILNASVNFFDCTNFLSDLFRFGKASSGQPIRLTVPKRWFLHFYIIGTFAVTLALSQVIRVNIIGTQAPPWLLRTLSWLTAVYSPSCSPESAVLAMCLLTAQIYRRLYEHLFVHVPSNTRMHVAHYLAGILHYVLGVAAVLAETPGFVPDNRSRRLFDATKLSWLDRGCGAVFMLAWLHQYRANCIFANLRKDESGALVSREHAVPRGDWFQYVSCPHYLAEVVMYSCLAVILGPRHASWIAVWLWVVSNQTGSALMSHAWYRKKFEDYPAERRAIFPYLL